MTQYQSSDKSLAAKSFAVALHDSWGVGGTHDGRENGVVIFLSVEDRVVYISTGRDVKHLVTAEEIKVLIESIKPDLRKEDYGRAIALMIIRIELILQRSGNAYNQGTLLSTSQNSTPLYGVLVQPLLFLCLFVVAWRLYSSDKKTNREQRLMEGKAKLDAFMQDVNQSLDNKKYITSSCPICLEEYCAEPDKENVEATEQFQNSPLRPVRDLKRTLK